jgi:hypothetical protein
MQKFITTSALAVLLAFAAADTMARGKRGEPRNFTPGTCLNTADVMSADTALDAEEADLLVFMREEEKLARDVYLVLYETWGQNVFAAIADSEQRHMDTMGRMLSLYGIDDPVTDNNVGAFVTPELADLYDALVLRGGESLPEALRVGALIEEVDIQDLEDAIAGTDEVELSRAYSNLLRGSQNHLRAFVRQVELLGLTYQAQVLDQDDVDAILAASSGNRGGAARGRGRR